MNTLDDLRRTLADHSPADDDLAARPAAVARRVSGVRRRRAAAGALLAATVIAGGGWYAVAGPQHDDHPAITNGADTDAPATLLGHDVPETITFGGYTYEYVSGVEGRVGSTLVSTAAPAAERPLLVTWVTERTGTAEVQTSKTAFAPEAAAPFEGRALLDAAYSTDDFIRVRAHSRPAIAIYELSATPPPGYTKDGITFRQQVDGRTLLTAGLGDIDQRELSVTVTLPEEPWFAFYCASTVPFDGRQPSPWLTAEVDGWFLMGSSCGRSDERNTDPGGILNKEGVDDAPGLTVSRPDGRGGVEKRHLEPGEEVTLVIRFTDKDGKDYPGDGASVQLGVGVYAGR